MALSSKISDAITGGRSQAFLSDGIFDVLFDAVIDKTDSNNFSVSRHTIEDGADVTDHVHSDPLSIDINAVLTDDDFDLLDPTGFIDETIEDRLETLEIWRDEKPILTYFGHETDIEDLVISNFTTTKTLDTGDGIGITISLTKINVVAAQIEAISLSNVTAKGATSKGTSKKAGNATTKKSTSILKGLIG